MSYEHVKYMEFKNGATKAVFNALVAHQVVEVQRPGPSVRARALDRADTDMVIDEEGEQYELDRLEQLAESLEDGVGELFEGKGLPDPLSVDGIKLHLCKVGLDAVDWEELARAVLIHDDLWEDYLQEKDRWEDERLSGEDYESEEEEDEAEISAT